jgi:hypothetical protein
MNSPNYSLNNVNTYKKSIDSNPHEILYKYFLLVNGYLKNIQDHKKVNGFIIMRGLKTITHVYTLLLYYTRNIDASYYHAQKSFYFYIEFVEQITDDQHSFLNLNTMDACMFVYKKTIFEINNDIKKTISPLSRQCSCKMNKLDIYINIIGNMIEYCQNDTDILVTDMKHINCYNSTVLDNIARYQLSIHESKVDTKEYLGLIYGFISKQRKNTK